MTRRTERVVEKAMRAIAAVLAARRLKTVAYGVEHIPHHGPALIVARHYHHLFDGLALFAAVRRPFHIVVTLDWIRSRPTKLFMMTLIGIARWPLLLRADAVARQNSGGLFSARDVLRYQRRALRESIELLARGRILVIFPEGYPNIDPAYTPKRADEHLPFKSGFMAILAAAEKRLQRKIPIVPAGIHYSPGKPWIGKITFGVPFIYDKGSEAELLEGLQKTVRDLSA